MDEGCAQGCFALVAIVLGLWLAFTGMAYGGMAVLIGVEHLALAFTWVGAGNPVLGWGLLGGVAGGLAGLLIGLNRAGRDVKPFGAIGGSLVLSLLLLLSGVSAADSSDYETAVADDEPTPLSTEEKGGPVSGFAVTINTERLNVREGPSSSSDVVTTVNEGERLEVLDTRGDWQQVSVRADGKQREGWVHSSYTQRAGRRIEQDERRAPDDAPLAADASENERSDARDADEYAREEDDQADEESPKIENPLRRWAERRREEREREEEVVPVGIVSLDAPDELTVGERGTFTATVNEGEATPPIDSNWDFGNGATGEGLVSTYTYDEPGIYTVSYRVSNEGGTEEALARVTVEERNRPSSLSFDSGASATVSVEEYDFEITVLGGKAIEAPGGNTRLDVEVRQKSINYDGDWVRWGHILKESYIVVGGRRYDVQRAASDNLGSGSASSGGTRTGTLVFQLDTPLSDLERPTLHFAYFPYRGVQSTRLPFSVR